MYSITINLAIYTNPLVFKESITVEIGGFCPPKCTGKETKNPRI